MKNRLYETINVTPNLTYVYPFWEFRSDWGPVYKGYESSVGMAYINALFIIERTNIADCRDEVVGMLLTKIEQKPN